MEADVLYVVGGLYGNLPALEALLRMAECERGRVTLVFNGDFHWFDIDEATYSVINAEVLCHAALRGNVETEIAGDNPAAGCGCAYPDWVTDEEVARSNAISERLRVTARCFPRSRARLAGLAMHATARVGGVRIGIVHGDAHALAGWRYAQEVLQDKRERAALASDFSDAGCRIIASSHTCLPVAIDCATAQGHCVLINNGAAGMPNFRDSRHGIVTRIALTPSVHSAALYATRLDNTVIEALPLHYDHARWLRDFLANWPRGTPAHQSYFKRIAHGPAYGLEEAVRWRTVEAPDKPYRSARERVGT
jgi:hypothetical protein